MEKKNFRSHLKRKKKTYRLTGALIRSAVRWVSNRAASTAKSLFCLTTVHRNGPCSSSITYLMKKLSLITMFILISFNLEILLHVGGRTKHSCHY